jgi:hypothetical protein
MPTVSLPELHGTPSPTTQSREPADIAEVDESPVLRLLRHLFIWYHLELFV